MKILKYTFIGLTGLIMIIIMVLDRLLMAPFVNIGLPPIDYTKGIPKPTKDTPTDVKAMIKVEIEDSRKEFINDYLLPASKRVLIISILTSILLWII